MNKIFRVIWNPTTGDFTVAGEVAKGRGKKSGRSKLFAAALISMSALIAPESALANTGETVDTGEGVDTDGKGSPAYNGEGWVATGKDAKANVFTNEEGASTAVGFEANAGGKWSTAIGAKTAASGATSMAFGVSAESSGEGSTALGPSSQALGNYSMALGALSVARGDFSQAFGYKSTATGENALAFGEESRADADNSIAMGTKAHARGEFSLALGAGSNTVGDSSIAFGANSYANGTQSLAFGLASQANEENAIAIGYNSLASNENAIALGQGSSAGAKNVVVIGSDASATGPNSVALGAGSLAIEDYTVSVGNSGAYGDPVFQRRIVNMAKGTISKDSTDAINGSQIYDVSLSVATRLGGGATVNTTTGIVNAPNYMLRTGTSYSDVGSALTAIDNVTLQWDSRAIAYSAARKDQYGKLNPTNITNVADGAIAANSTDAINGSQLNTTNTNVSNLSNTVNNIDNTVDSHSVSIQGLENDALLWDATADGGSGAFSAAHGTDKTASKITNVAVGAVTSASTDAINGSQLHSLSSNIANYFGGNASVDANGNFTGPTYNIDGKDYNSVGDALAAIDVSMADSLGDALMWDDANGSYNANHNGSASKIANVAAGTVDVASKDAINGSQLYGVSSSVVDALGGGTTVNADGSISAPTFTIANADYNNVGDALDAIDSTLDDALLWDSSADAFSAAHGTSTTSKITNVAAGAITTTSTDAINGSQLHDLSSNIVSYFGGDASVDANGNFTGPTYNIDGTDYTSVGDALAAIEVSMGESLGDALMWDDKANAYSASHNGTASKITDVADGNIAADSTDAVNGSQLNDTNMLINQIAGDTSSSYIEENGGGVKYVRTNDTGLAFEDASASGVGATALGYNAQASGESSVAIGQNSVSTIDGGIALGSGSMSNRVIAQGTQATSVSNSVVTIGYDTTDEQLLGALSLGKDGESYRQIINVADGTEAHDVVTVRQLQNAIGSVTTTPVKYYHANSAAEDSLAIGEDSLAMGPKTVVNADAGIGVGLNAIVVQEAINGIAIGTNAQVNHAGSIAIGSGSRTSIGAETNYLAYNMDTPQNSVGEFSVGSEDGQRKITNVAAGSQDTDAVNVGQLKVTDERVSQNTQNISILNNQVSNLDTRVTNLENGMGDIITTGSTKYFKANSTGADANAQGADSVAMGSGSIAAADNSVALGTGSVADEANTVSVGSSTNQRRITNVAAGVNDTDAVNVSQLKSSEAGSVRYDTKTDGSIDYSSITLGGGNGGTTRISNVSAGVENNDAVNYAQLKQSVQETKQYTDQRMAQMDSKLSKTESKLSGGIASAMAMTGMPQAYSPGASMASIGGGSYNGESAVALGVSMVSDNGRWVYKLQGSTNSQGEYSAAIGAGIQW